MSPRVSRWAILCLTLLGAVLAPAVSGWASQPQSTLADEVFSGINAQRAASLRAPLTRLRTAELAAQLHAMDMANREYMNHYTLASDTPIVPDPVAYPNIRFTGGMSPGDRLAASGYGSRQAGWGENIAWNFGYGTQSAQAAVTAWMNSDGHRANILYEDFKGTGVGCARSASGTIYYCQVFVTAIAGHPTIGSNAELGAGTSSSPPPVTVPVVDTTPPAGWNSFTPAVTLSLAPDCRVSVSDSGRGLDVASARSRYSRDGGLSWSGWTVASCTGSSGTTVEQQITAAGVPFNQVSSQNQVQFQIADVAGNIGTSPVYGVTVQAPAGSGTPPPAGSSDTIPPGASPGFWSRFSPASTDTVSPVCTIDVLDAGGSGLNVGSAEYRFSTDGGATWSPWNVALCTGSDRATSRQQIATSNVPFNQVSASRNQIQFRVQDMAGNIGTSGIYTVDTSQ